MTNGCCVVALWYDNSMVYIVAVWISRVGFTLYKYMCTVMGIIPCLADIQYARR